jgi:hypothetical protein
MKWYKDHPYRRAALWAALLVIVSFCALLMPSGLFHNNGSPPGGYFIEFGKIVLMPGVLVSEFVYYPVYYPSAGSSAGFCVWITIVALVNWVFYCGIFALIARLRRRSPQPLP